MADSTVTINGLEFTLERELNASRSAVWEAWTNPDKLAKWWGPRGWTTSIEQFNFIPGGFWLYCMKCIDENQTEWFGQESWGKATFKNINPQDSFDYIDEFSDSEGNSTPGMPVSTTTLEFIETADDKTLLRSTTTFESEEALKQVIDMGMEQGIKETWDRLAETVEKVQI